MVTEPATAAELLDDELELRLGVLAQGVRLAAALVLGLQ